MNIKHKEILAMVYPYGLFNNYYIKFYDEFLKNYILKISNEVRIVLVVINEKAKDVLTSKFSDNNFEAVIIPEAVDIWIRDWAPIPVKYTNGDIKYLNPNFTTGYYEGSESAYIPKLKKAGQKLSEYLGIQITELPLNTDGANFAFNGKDTIILTNRIIANNESLSIDEIKNIYKSTLGIKKVIFVPVESGDVTGHTDGTIRFIDENTIVIGKYPYRFKKENIFIEKLTKELTTQLGNDYKIISLENDIINDEGVSSDVCSATGNHINYLIIGKKIFLPTYGIDSDDIAYNTFKLEYPSYDIIRIISKEITKISKDGGVLNCITWG